MLVMYGMRGVGEKYVEKMDMGGIGWKIKGVGPKMRSAWFSSFSPSQRQVAKLTPLIQFFVLMRQILYYQGYDASMIATER